MRLQKALIDHAVQQLLIKVRMLNESDLIIESVDFLEQLIEVKLLEIDRAISEYNYAQVDVIKEQIFQLFHKLNLEEVNMDNYMAKYAKLKDDEEKALLSSISQKKQVSLRGVPPNSRRTCTSKGLERQAERDKKA